MYKTWTIQSLPASDQTHECLVRDNHIKSDIAPEKSVFILFFALDTAVEFGGTER